MEQCELLDCLKMLARDAINKSDFAEDQDERVYWRGFSAGVEAAADKTREQIRWLRLMSLPD
jgi:hypothetical protein